MKMHVDNRQLALYSKEEMSTNTVAKNIVQLCSCTASLKRGPLNSYPGGENIVSYILSNWRLSLLTILLVDH